MFLTIRHKWDSVLVKIERKKKLLEKVKASLIIIN